MQHRAWPSWGEAIVAPTEIMKYFAREDIRRRNVISRLSCNTNGFAVGCARNRRYPRHDGCPTCHIGKPFGTSWITYTRSHDDIGLGYEDYMIEEPGWNAFGHRNFLKDYYAGIFPGSPASGALFSSNPKTGDARISGTLASLCGLETALKNGDQYAVSQSIDKILMMQALSFFIGGMPMLFYGDELGYTNDYSYLEDPGKSYDNRWMHRPVMDWERIKQIEISGSTEERIFPGLRNYWK
ncbi:MAG: hypothetical protein WDM78_19210 [Puia sp.]